MPDLLAPDSPVATEYRPGLGVRAGELHERPGPVRAAVIHTTGSGVAARVNGGRFSAWRAKNPEASRSTFTAAAWVYDVALPASGHYLVGQDGECVQIVRESTTAHHVGSRHSLRYRLPRAAWCRGDLRWWAERWPALSSPRALAGGRLWAGGSCNDSTVGIEVACPLDDPSGPWSDAAWATLARLVSDVCLRHDVPCSREYVVTHSDAHPVARSARGAASDPGPRQWSWRRFADEAGAPF